ncbi:MAG: glycosyltransferase [Acidobacteriota bacterium]
MKLLYLDAYSSYPLARAGGHRSGHSLLARVAQRDDWHCMTLMPKRGRGALLPAYDPKVSDFAALGIRSFHRQSKHWIFDCGYPVWAVDEVQDSLEEVFERYQPDLVYCQSPEVLPLLREARQRQLAAIWYIRDTRPRAEDLRTADRLGVQLIALSRFARDRIHDIAGVEAEVLHSLIEPEHYQVEPASDGRITLINPIAMKGFELFVELAAQLPQLPFLAVEAWPLGDDLERVLERLEPLPNVHFLEQQADMRQVYRQTRLLLVPSIVEEGGPRVAREAQLSGIPVVGSARGAIAEHTGAGGIILESDDPRAWAEVVQTLWTHAERYAALKERAWHNARREEFTVSFQIRRFVEICALARQKAEAASN